MAVVDDSSPYGEGLADGVRGRLGYERAREVFKGHIDSTATGDAAIFTELIEANPTAVFFGGLSVGAGRLLGQLRADGFSGHFMSDAGADNPQFVSAAGGASIADGAYLSCACADESAQCGSSSVHDRLSSPVRIGPSPVFG